MQCQTLHVQEQINVRERRVLDLHHGSDTSADDTAEFSAFKSTNFCTITSTIKSTNFETVLGSVKHSNHGSNVCADPSANENPNENPNRRAYSRAFFQHRLLHCADKHVRRDAGDLFCSRQRRCLLPMRTGLRVQHCGLRHVHRRPDARAHDDTYGRTFARTHPCTYKRSDEASHNVALGGSFWRTNYASDVRTEHHTHFAAFRRANNGAFAATVPRPYLLTYLLTYYLLTYLLTHLLTCSLIDAKLDTDVRFRLLRD